MGNLPLCNLDEKEQRWESNEWYYFGDGHLGQEIVPVLNVPSTRPLVILVEVTFERARRDGK
jgi:hypothetical protein